MRINYKTTSSVTILALVQLFHVDNPTDTDLIICELPESEARTLAMNLPDWVKSFSFAPELPSRIVEIFRENLSTSNQLKEQTDSKEIKRKIAREEKSDLKKLRKPIEKSSMDLGTTFLYSGAYILAVSADFQSLITASQVNKQCYQTAYLRLFGLAGEKTFVKQQQNLGLLIKNAFRFFKVPNIENTLINYKNREDIPAENRILAIACLVILAILKKDNENFKKNFTELFIFSAIDPILFKILSCYIYLYKGEYIKCRELVRAGIKDALYDRKYDYLKPQENFGAMLQSRALELSDQLQGMENHLRSAYERMEYFDVQSELVIFEKLRQFPLLELKLTQACIKYIKLLHQKNEDGSNNKLLLFPLLPFITQSTPAVDFAELCFSLNYFSLNVQDNHFMDDNNILPVVELFSSKNKQKVLDMLINALERMLQDSYFHFSSQGCYYKNTKMDGRIELYLELIQALNPRMLGTFVQKHLDAYLDAVVPTDKLNGLNFVIHCAGDLIDKQVPKLWLIYKKITTVSSLKVSTKKIQVAIANIIGRNFEEYRHLPGIDWAAIKASMFYGVVEVRETTTYKNSFFSSRESDSIVVLSKLCKDSPVMVDDKTKLAISTGLFSSSYSQKDAELWVMVLQCCFKNREELSELLNEQVRNDKQSKDSKLALLHGSTVNEKSMAVRAVVALAPFLEVVLVERLFDEIDQHVKKIIDVLEDDNEWFDFLEALTNLVFYISPEKRKVFFASLSKKQHDAMYNSEDPEFPLTMQTCLLLSTKQELLEVKRVDLHSILLPFRNYVVNSFSDLRLNILKELLLVLYEKKDDYETQGMLDYYLEEIPQNKDRLGSIISQLFQIAEKRGSQEKDRLLAEFKGATEHFIKSQGATINHSNIKQHARTFEAVIEVPIQEITLLLQVKFACLTNNSIFLNYVLKERNEKLTPDALLQLKAEMQQELQKLRGDGFVFNEKIQGILADFNRELISDVRPTMVIS